MKALVVIAHPLEDSLCQHLASKAVESLELQGYQVEVKNLYQQQFEPCLQTQERQSYYAEQFDQSHLEAELAELKQAEHLVLVFPTWWFGFPAILKGWFDRVWAPSHAFNHADDLGAITPLLHNLKQVTAITSLGSPWWVDYFVLWKPVHRILKIALLGACTKNCKLKMFSLYKAEEVSQSRAEEFTQRICRYLNPQN